MFRICNARVTNEGGRETEVGRRESGDGSRVIRKGGCFFHQTPKHYDQPKSGPILVQKRIPAFKKKDNKQSIRRIKEIPRMS